MTPRAVLVTGGTGFVGRHLVTDLLSRGITAWVWSRDATRARGKLDPRVQVIDRLEAIPRDAPIDAIVDLAGAPVIGPPWTKGRRRLLIDSRVKTTNAVIGWCAHRETPPRVLICASAIGFYGPADDVWLDESSAPQDVFQSELCQRRESAARQAESLGMRVVNARLGLVLGNGGGILGGLALSARAGAAAVIADGRQWMSWIHVADLIRVLDRMIVDDSFRGPCNAVAPEPVRQRDFQRELTRVLRRPLLLRIPGPLLYWTLGEMAELLVKGQRVAPKRLRDAGFEFRHPALRDALEDLLRPGRS